MEIAPDTPAAPAPGRRSAGLALLAILAYWLAQAVAERLYLGPVAYPSSWGVTHALARTALDCGAILLGLLIIGRLEVLSRAVFLAFAVSALMVPVLWLYSVRWNEGEATPFHMILALAVPAASAVSWSVWAGGMRGAVLALVPGLAFLAAQGGGAWLGSDYLWVTEEWAAWEAEEQNYEPFDVEGLYAAQAGLLGAQIAALAPQRPGQVEAFALTLGGTADQSVFARQVDEVGAILDSAYGAGERLLKLSNSEDDPLRYPMANHANLEAALAAIGQRMWAEDLAFLYLASHGGPDVFALEFYDAGLSDLLADELAAMLDQAGIGNAVIVLSACHAGSFIDNLRRADRLIIAAARADRTSFGCADGVDWTEFDQSFFDFALRQDPDPRKAFALASQNLWWKELTSLRRHSYPQIDEGAEIGPVLDALPAGPAE